MLIIATAYPEYCISPVYKRKLNSRRYNARQQYKHPQAVRDFEYGIMIARMTCQLSRGHLKRWYLAPFPASWLWRRNFLNPVQGRLVIVSCLSRIHWQRSDMDSVTTVFMTTRSSIYGGPCDKQARDHGGKSKDILYTVCSESPATSKSHILIPSGIVSLHRRSDYYSWTSMLQRHHTFRIMML